ncbi:cholecystokinin receptor type A-like [Mya arenaria]|uniref:cholecystokinin receptor type A-like n=1 Tax=Mya arenaria TaxID=6604 RepID=UPI0022E3B179|nr:cholecystokinin receptor type A-like [Mya arenaria]
MTNISLEDLNRREVIRQIPLFIYLIIIGITGSIGNALVFYVYKKKYGRSNCRTFILCLSVIGLIACVCVIPIEILTLFHEYNFYRERICKTSVFLNTWPTLTSGVLLLCIAIDRYRKVCRPFKWQISHRESIIMCIAAGVIGVAFSWISPVIYGIQTSRHPHYDINVTTCVETDSAKATVFPILNNVLFAVLFVCSLAGIIVMYCFIGVSIKHHNERRTQFLGRRDVVSTAANEPLRIKSENANTTSDPLFCSDDKNSERISKRKSAISTLEPERSNRHSILSSMMSYAARPISFLTRTLSSKYSGNEVNYRQKDRRSQKQYNAMKTAKIMFQVSLAFIVSYTPLLCILLIRTFNSDFVQSLNDSQRTAYKFFLRSYYLNFALNPIIYGVRDVRFRQACKHLLCRCKK